MNRRDLMKASAAQAALALGALRWRTGRAAANDVYIDPAVMGAGHAGTYADPYGITDAETFFWLLLGDQGGRRIRFRAGTTFVGRVAISGCDNYSLEPYGDGAPPVISNHLDVSGLTWLADDGARGGPAPDVWYIPVAGVPLPWSAGETAVIFNDGSDDIQCEARTTYADLVGPQYACNEANYSATPFVQYWDTTSVPGRMWVRVPPGLDPNAAIVLVPRPDQIVMSLGGGTGVTVSDLVLQCGAVCGLLAHEVSELTLTRVAARNIGGRSSAAQDVFNLVGISNEYRSTNIVMRSCSAYRSLQRTSSHALEISWLDGLIVEDFVAKDVRLHGIEFWSSCSNVTIRRMIARQCGASLVTFQVSSDEPPGASHHDNVLIENSECVQRASYFRHATSGLPAGGSGIVTCPAGTNQKLVSNLRIYNNSFDVDAAFALYSAVDANAQPGAGNNAVTFQGNVCRFSQITGSEWGGIYAPTDPDAAAEWVMDRNVYQFAVTPANGLYVGGVPVSSQSAWRAAWDEIPGAASNEDRSVITSAPLYRVPGGTLRGADLSLASAQAAAVGLADATDPATPATDILGIARDAAPDAGAYEYVPGPGPEPFTFTPFAAAAFTTVTSLPVSLSGITGSATIAVSGDPSALYSVNSTTAFTASPGTVVDGDIVRARVTSGAGAGSVRQAVVTINGQAGTFAVTTE